MPQIPPFLGRNQFVTDFLVKANFFNDYFSEQCTTIGNNSSVESTWFLNKQSI